MMECEQCNGFGYIEFLVNSTGYHLNGEEPIIEKEPCEYCNQDIGNKQNEEKEHYSKLDLCE